MTRWLFGLAAVGLILVAAAPAFATPAGDNFDGLLLGLQLESSATSAAIARADATLAQLQAELSHKERELRRALQDRRLSEAQKQDLRRKLADAEAQISKLIADLKSRDLQYAVEIEAYGEGIKGLLAKSDPHIVAAFERYLEGDRLALHDIQALTRIRSAALEAGAAALNAAVIAQVGSDLRAVALLFGDEHNRGERSAQEALDAWIEAADKDPSVFYQWQQIYFLSLETGGDAVARRAREAGWKAANSDFQRAQFYLWPSADSVQPPGLLAGESPFDAAMRLFHRLSQAEPNNVELQLRILGALDLSTTEALDELETSFPNGVPEAASKDARAKLAEADGVAERLRAAYPTSDIVLRAVWLHYRAAAQSAMVDRNWNVAAALYTKAQDVELQRAKLGEGVGRSDEVLALEDLSTLQQLNRDPEAASATLWKAADTSAAMSRADPSSLSTAHSAWGLYTRLGMWLRAQGDSANGAKAFTKALEIGRAQPPDAHLDYMVDLTRERLALALASQGKFAAAEAQFNPWPRSFAAGQLTSENSYLFAGKADIAVLVGKSEVARGYYRALKAASASAATNQAISAEDRVHLEMEIDSSLAQIEIDEGRYDAGIAILRTIDQKLTRAIAETPSNVDLRVTQLGIQAELADWTAGAGAWKALADKLQSAKIPPDEASKFGMSLPAIQQLAAQLAALDAEPTPGTGLATLYLANLRKRLTVLRVLEARDPANPYFAWLTGGTLIQIARITKTGADWIAARDAVVGAARRFGMVDMDRQNLIDLAVIRANFAETRRH